MQQIPHRPHTLCTFYSKMFEHLWKMHFFQHKEFKGLFLKNILTWWIWYDIHLYYVIQINVIFFLRLLTFCQQFQFVASNVFIHLLSLICIQVELLKNRWSCRFMATPCGLGFYVSIHRDSEFSVSSLMWLAWQYNTHSVSWNYYTRGPSYTKKFY